MDILAKVVFHLQKKNELLILVQSSGTFPEESKTSEKVISLTVKHDDAKDRKRICCL